MWAGNEEYSASWIPRLERQRHTLSKTKCGFSTRASECIYEYILCTQVSSLWAVWTQVSAHWVACMYRRVVSTRLFWWACYKRIEFRLRGHTAAYGVQLLSSSKTVDRQVRGGYMLGLVLRCKSTVSDWNVSKSERLFEFRVIRIDLSKKK